MSCAVTAWIRSFWSRCLQPTVSGGHLALGNRQPGRWGWDWAGGSLTGEAQAAGPEQIIGWKWGYIYRVKKSKYAAIIWLWYTGICVALNQTWMVKFFYVSDLSYVDSFVTQFSWSSRPSTKIWSMCIWARGQGSLTSDQRIHMCNNGGGSLAYDKNNEKFLDFQIRIVIIYITEGWSYVFKWVLNGREKQVK